MNQNTTRAAWTIFRKLELESGRKFTSADRKGKDSAWAKAMRDACQLVATEIEFGLEAEAAMRRVNRLAGLALSRAETSKLLEPHIAKALEFNGNVSPLLRKVKKYNEFSVDYEERSETRRAENCEAITHNNNIIANFATEQLSAEQKEESKELGMRADEYLIAGKRAKANGMSVTTWMEKIKAEEAEQEAKERQEMADRHLAWFFAKNKQDVAMMRRRYARRKYKY